MILIGSMRNWLLLAVKIWTTQSSFSLSVLALHKIDEANRNLFSTAAGRKLTQIQQRLEEVEEDLYKQEAGGIDTLFSEAIVLDSCFLFS